MLLRSSGAFGDRNLEPVAGDSRNVIAHRASSWRRIIHSIPSLKISGGRSYSSSRRMFLMSPPHRRNTDAGLTTPPGQTVRQ